MLLVAGIAADESAKNTSGAAAQQFVDSSSRGGNKGYWLSRYYLGVAYVHAGHYAEALSELEACVKRQGEVTAVFMDDVPSYRYAVAVPYWLARAQEGVQQKSNALANYKRFTAPTRSPTP